MKDKHILVHGQIRTARQRAQHSGRKKREKKINTFGYQSPEVLLSVCRCIQFALFVEMRSHCYGAPEGTRKLKSFEWLDCTNNKVLNVAIAQTIKF